MAAVYRLHRPLPDPSDKDAIGEHVSQFERWFILLQQDHGLEGDPLTSIEHAILRSYITWLRKDDANNQAQREV